MSTRRIRTIEAAAALTLLAGASRADVQHNPAADLCRADGATIVEETAPNGHPEGFCVFPNGTRIKEGAYFRNKHRTQR